MTPKQLDRALPRIIAFLVVTIVALGAAILTHRPDPGAVAKREQAQALREAGVPIDQRVRLINGAPVASPTDGK